MKVAVYARVSTKEQNPEVQIAELLQYCQQREWYVVGEPIIDHGFSGGDDERPGIKKLYIMAASRQIDGIVVIKLDRLFRSLRHFVEMMDELQTYGVGLTCVKEPIDYTTHTGRMIVQLLAVLAEFERGMIKERIQAGLEWAKAQGIHCGRPIGGGGKNHKERPDEQIVELFLEGWTRRRIATELCISKGSVDRVIKAYTQEI